MQVTDEMVDAALQAWFRKFPSLHGDKGYLAEMRAALTAALSGVQTVEVKAEYSHEDRVTLASCLSWDINEITPSDVKGILERLETEGYRLVRSALVDVQAVEPGEWRRSDGTMGGTLLYTLREDGWRRGKPMLVNDVTVRIERANGSKTDIEPIVRLIHAALTATRSGSATSASGGCDHG